MKPPPPYLGHNKDLITAGAMAYYQPDHQHSKERINSLDNKLKHRKV